MRALAGGVEMLVTASRRDCRRLMLLPLAPGLDSVVSMAEAEALLAQSVDAFRAALGDRLVAAYALGSLAHGGFSALVSDVDLGLILADPVQSRDGETIEAIAES